MLTGANMSFPLAVAAPAIIGRTLPTRKPERRPVEHDGFVGQVGSCQRIAVRRDRHR